MSLQSLAKRMGIASPSAIVHLEKAEVKGTITLKRLRAAADALNCDVAVVLIPRTGLEEWMQRQARAKAIALVDRLGHTMALEKQEVSSPELEELVNKTAQELLERGDAGLWE